MFYECSDRPKSKCNLLSFCDNVTNQREEQLTSNCIENTSHNYYLIFVFTPILKSEVHIVINRRLLPRIYTVNRNESSSHYMELHDFILKTILVIG